MASEYTSSTIRSEYEPKSVLRTFSGVASAILFMGVPVGLTEFLRPGGDTTTWQIAFLSALAAIGLAVVSVRGTLKN